MNRLAWPRLLVLAVGLTLVGPAAHAQDEWSYELWNDLMSPYCPGRTLADCPSGQAEALREWIVEQERQGVPREQVEEQLYARYGDVIRQAPVPSGFGLAAYVIPVLAFLAGGAFVLWFLRRSRRETPGPVLAAASASGAPPSADPDLEKVLDEELRDA